MNYKCCTKLKHVTKRRAIHYMHEDKSRNMAYDYYRSRFLESKAIPFNYYNRQPQLRLTFNDLSLACLRGE